MRRSRRLVTFRASSIARGGSERILRRGGRFLGDALEGWGDGQRKEWGWQAPAARANADGLPGLGFVRVVAVVVGAGRSGSAADGRPRTVAELQGRTGDCRGRAGTRAAAAGRAGLFPPGP